MTRREPSFPRNAVDGGAECAAASDLTGCPWHDVKSMLREVGLRPTRQRMALGWILFAKGDRHLTAEMLYEEATQRQGAGVARHRLQHAAPVHRSRPAAPGRGRRLEDLFRHQHLRRITTSSSRATTSWSTFPAPTWSSARRRSRPKATRSPASTWWCGCGARAEASARRLSRRLREPIVRACALMPGVSIGGRGRPEARPRRITPPSRSDRRPTAVPAGSSRRNPGRRMRHQVPVQRFTAPSTPACSRATTAASASGLFVERHQFVLQVGATTPVRLPDSSEW